MHTFCVDLKSHFGIAKSIVKVAVVEGFSSYSKRDLRHESEESGCFVQVLGPILSNGTNF